MASITEAGWESRLEDDAPPDKRPRMESGCGGDKSVREGGDDGDKSAREGGDDGDKSVRDDRAIPHEDYYSSDDEPRMPKELCEMYWKQLKESEGFDCIDLGDYLGVGMVKRQEVDDGPMRDYAIPYAEMAMKHFNKKEDANFEFVRLVALTTQVVAGVFLYITFEAKDAYAQIKTFQALVFCGINEGDVEIQFCRLKRPPTKRQGTEHEQVGQASTCC